MKKVVFIFSFLVFSLGFASSVEDAIEDSLILKYPSISDGKTSIKVHEYDVDIDHHKIELKIEVKGDETKEKFEKLNKSEKVDFELLKQQRKKWGKPATRLKLLKFTLPRR